MERCYVSRGGRETKIPVNKQSSDGNVKVSDASQNSNHIDLLVCSPRHSSTSGNTSSSYSDATVDMPLQLPPIKFETQMSRTHLADDFQPSPRETPSPRPDSGLVRPTNAIHPTQPTLSDSKDAEANACVSCPETPVKSDSPAKTVGRVTAALIMGVVFGWMLQKSSVYKPSIIRNQFFFTEFVMLKTFLAALASSQIFLICMRYIPFTKSFFEEAKSSYCACLVARGIVSTVIGAFLLGSGMAISAACPGMVLAQLGSLVPNSAYTVCGGLLGCLFYGFIHEKIQGLITPRKPFSTFYIDEFLKLPYAALAVPCAVLCMMVVILMEVFIPETADTKWPVKLIGAKLNDSGVVSLNRMESCEDVTYNTITQEMWYPSVCGVFIGLLQIPLVLILSDTLGSSSGYMTISSQWICGDSMKKRYPYFAKFKGWLENYWMVVFLLGAILGSALAAYSSCSLLITPGPPWWQALLGGFIMLLGARFGAGCTSGHGISGAALLTGLSWLAVPTMFAGGIFTAFMMRFSHTDLYVGQWQPS